MQIPDDGPPAFIGALNIFGIYSPGHCLASHQWALCTPYSFSLCLQDKLRVDCDAIEAAESKVQAARMLA